MAQLDVTNHRQDINPQRSLFWEPEFNRGRRVSDNSLGDCDRVVISRSANTSPI